jgi:hypothetical protein
MKKIFLQIILVFVSTWSIFPHPVSSAVLTHAFTNTTNLVYTNDTDTHTMSPGCNGSSPASYTWSLSVNGVSISGTQTCAPAVVPVCATTHYNCTTGTVGATAEYGDRFQWWCNGSTLPANAAPNLLCEEMKPTVNLWFSFLNTTKSLFSGMLPSIVFAEE